MVYQYPTLVIDTDDTLAVVSNTNRMMCKMTGHERVEEVGVSQLAIVQDNDVTWIDNVGEGKYRSAVFARFEAGLEGVPVFVSGEYLFIQITESLKGRLMAVVGRKVTREAMDSEGKKHSFVWNVMNAPEDEKAFIRITWS